MERPALFNEFVEIEELEQKTAPSGIWNGEPRTKKPSAVIWD